MPGSPSIRIGTRGSALALVQATLVRDALGAAGVSSTLVEITTQGDRRAPDTAWGEGAFVSAIEMALLDGDVDVAVHSAKDVPTDEDPRLTIAAYPPRAPSADVIVLPMGASASSLDDLPIGVRVGTDSPRRTAFLRAVRPDLRLHPLHGNVDTRLRRLDAGETDALVLAEAGLERLGRTDRIAFRLDPEVLPSAPGQGALAIQVRADDARAVQLIGRLDDPETRLAVEAERALLAASGGGCRAPIGAVARVTGDEIDLLGGFARPDGTIATIGRRIGALDDPTIVDRLLEDLAARSVTAARAVGGPRVLVTRASGQMAALLLALVDRGLVPLAVPAISIEPGGDGLVPALANLAEYDWVVVTSGNAARAIQAAALAGGHDLSPTSSSAGPRWAAVGVATAGALRSAGVSVAFRPARSSGAGLAESIPIEPGARVLLPRSEIADRALVEAFEARGARVDAVTAYRTVEAPQSSRPLLSAALDERPNATILTSGSTARGLLALAESVGLAPAALAVPAICIGAETATEATRLGFAVAAKAPAHGVAALADTAARYLLPVQETR